MSTLPTPLMVPMDTVGSDCAPAVVESPANPSVSTPAATITEVARRMTRPPAPEISRRQARVPGCLPPPNRSAKGAGADQGSIGPPKPVRLPIDCSFLDRRVVTVGQGAHRRAHDLGRPVGAGGAERDDAFEIDAARVDRGTQLGARLTEVGHLVPDELAERAAFGAVGRE